MGGTETLWLSHLLRTAYSQYFRQAIRSEKLRMWMIPFLVPDYVPYPVFRCDVSDLMPKIEYAKVALWSVAPENS
jgi:hypothetical protein